MSEEILKALMQLFALIARDDGAGNGRSIVETFLRLRLNQQFVGQYLEIFDSSVRSHHQTTKRKDGTEKRFSLNSVKILKICIQINSELTQPQKVVVLLRLIEFISSNAEVIEQEFDLVHTVSETFNINNLEFSECLEFIQAETNAIPSSSNILIIDNKKLDRSEITKHIFIEGLRGQVQVLWIASVNLFALKYKGDEELYLNGQCIVQGKVYNLNPGSLLRNSRVPPVYYSDIQGAFTNYSTETKLSFVVENLEYRFNDGRIGLRQINLAEDSGQLIGIMGSSGSGKSTLLNVINGNGTPSAGSVKINGINIHKEKARLEGVIGMVSQDDLLIEELTVYQNLFYNAKLCFGKKNDEEIETIVLDTLSDLSLYKVRNLRVGSALDKIISGGQRKRLNIALELIREPSVLFLDEPTSGLSSRDSESIMDLLKALTLKGKLVFVVIHQPSSDIFKTFDKLLLIDDGGYPIYYGNTLNAIMYFKTVANQINRDQIECVECGNVSPEEIFNIIESKVLDEFGRATQVRKVLPIEWNKYYKEIIEEKMDSSDNVKEIPRSIYSIPSKYKQLKVFITRDLLSKLTNKQYLFINLLEAPVLAFILAYVIKYSITSASNDTEYVFRHNENLPVYIFMTIIVALFIGLMVSAEEIIHDREIRKREKFLNLSKGSYMWSKITVMFIISAIQTFLFVCVGNYVTEIQGMILEYWFMIFTIACFANLLGLNISSSFDSIITIYVLVPLLIIPQLLLSGAIVSFDKINPTISSQGNVPIIGDIMASRWGYEALVVKQFQDNKFYEKFYNYDKGMSVASYNKTYWLTELSNDLDKCEKNYKNPAQHDLVIRNSKLILSEILKECRLNGISIDKWSHGIDGLATNSFNPAVFQQIRDLLLTLKQKFINQYKFYNDLKEAKINALIKDSLSKKLFLKERQDYENERLTSLVTNGNSFQKLIKLEDRYIQKSNPVFHDPSESNLGRAHLFAPRKLFLNKYYDTYWFNSFVVWLMTSVLIVTLYFNLFWRIINLTRNLFSKLNRSLVLKSKS